MSAEAAVQRAFSHICLPAVVSGESMFEYAFGEKLEPVEKSLLNLPNAGAGKYAWFMRFDGGQLILTEAERATGPECQIHLRRGDGERVQAALEKILVCDDCYFRRDAAAAVQTRRVRVERYVWRYKRDEISVYAARQLHRAPADPALSISVSRARAAGP